MSTANKTVTKKELVRRAAYRAGVNAEIVAEVMEAFTEEIKTAVANGEQVTLPGFGVFESRERAARTARSPKSGEPVSVPARTVPAFRVSGAFRNYVIAENSGEPHQES